MGPREHRRALPQRRSDPLLQAGALILVALGGTSNPVTLADPAFSRQFAGEGATGTGSLKELVAALQKPRAVWVMVPAGQITEQTVSELGELLEAGDTIIDGGNSYYRDDIARAARLAKEGIH